MAGATGRAAALCSERFGSGTARGCGAAADGSLRWEAEAASWWRISQAFPAKPDGRGAGASAAAAPLSGLKAVLLPQGFPDSVSADYLPYQLWDSVQAFASSLSGALATHAVMLGLGVGNADASLAAATATWLVKDSTGMLGRIIFAWWKGSKLDCNAKQWRLFADILNDAAMFLEIVAPALPFCFTVTISISNLAKCIVSVAGGATRAALTVHQARRNNMADVAAKDGSQETLVNLAGLLVSLVMLPLVSGSPSFSLGCFFLLTALHIYANYRAVHALVMETLNENRLQLLLRHFLQKGEILDTTSANRMEPLWTGFWPSLSLSLGVPLHRVISSVSELQQLVEGHQELYLLCWNQSRNQVQVVLSEMAGPEAVLKAATHGLLLGALQEDGPLPCELEELRNRLRAGPEEDSGAIVRETYRVLDKLFPPFLEGLQATGWQTEKHQLEVDEWRATWLLSPEKKDL
ncbi:RUS1 family protein C16orf58 homolog [Octodon degus]|uniref:RUS1 family protein C16orf58 homolog n=1 Tax=Octodon degus TaxID=10160 RepID=A0A6P3EPI0_OCTDE|nr:RUS1 family protein C16orf58 homolog [Octodon degus]